jgi:hypothetical protein
LSPKKIDTSRLASAVPTTVLSPAWLLTVLSVPPMELMLSTGATVSTANRKGSELPVFPAPSVCCAVIALLLPWPMVVRFAALSA